MSNHILIQAEFTINEDKIDEFQKLIRKMSKLVKTNEPDTLGYNFYFSSDRKKCIVHEKYQNSKAALVHNSGYASQTVLPNIFKVAKLNHLDVYGKPSKELQKLLSNFNAQIYTMFGGFNH